METPNQGFESLFNGFAIQEEKEGYPATIPLLPDGTYTLVDAYSRFTESGSVL